MLWNIWNILYPRASGHAGKLNTVSILVLSPKAPRVSTRGRDPNSVLLLEINIFKFVVWVVQVSCRRCKVRLAGWGGGGGNTAVIAVLFCIMQMGKQMDIKIKNYFLDSGRVSTRRAMGRTPDLPCHAIIIKSYSPTWQLPSLCKAFHWYICTFL